MYTITLNSSVLCWNAPSLMCPRGTRLLFWSSCMYPAGSSYPRGPLLSTAPPRTSLTYLKSNSDTHNNYHHDVHAWSFTNIDWWGCSYFAISCTCWCGAGSGSILVWVCEIWAQSPASSSSSPGRLALPVISSPSPACWCWWCCWELTSEPGSFSERPFLKNHKKIYNTPPPHPSTVSQLKTIDFTALVIIIKIVWFSALTFFPLWLVVLIWF